MEKRRRLKQNAACAAVATVIYVSGYLLIPDYGEIVPFRVRHRRFSTTGLARVYAPLGWLECKLTKQPVYLGGPESGEGVEFNPGELW
jgi:hypothetical protein